MTGHRPLDPGRVPDDVIIRDVWQFLIRVVADDELRFAAAALAVVLLTAKGL